jgi:hypothetical protein
VVIGGGVVAVVGGGVVVVVGGGVVVVVGGGVVVVVGGGVVVVPGGVVVVVPVLQPKLTTSKPNTKSITSALCIPLLLNLSPLILIAGLC